MITHSDLLYPKPVKKEEYEKTLSEIVIVILYTLGILIMFPIYKFLFYFEYNYKIVIIAVITARSLGKLIEVIL